MFVCLLLLFCREAFQFCFEVGVNLIKCQINCTMNNVVAGVFYLTRMKERDEMKLSKTALVLTLTANMPVGLCRTAWTLCR